MESCQKTDSQFWLKWLYFRTTAAISYFSEIFETGHREKTEYKNDISMAMKLYGNSVLRISYAYLHSMSDAEDVVQDTLIKLMQKDPQFESGEHEKAWLLHVAANICKNRLKSPYKSRTDELKEDYAAPKLDDELNEVWEAVKGLAPKYVAVIHLFYQEGYSTKEIASILKKNESTVRSLLSRARGLLKDSLKEAYDFDD